MLEEVGVDVDELIEDGTVIVAVDVLDVDRVDFDISVVEMLEVLLIWGEELESEKETLLLLERVLVVEDEVELAGVVELIDS